MLCPFLCLCTYCNWIFVWSILSRKTQASWPQEHGCDRKCKLLRLWRSTPKLPKPIGPKSQMAETPRITNLTQTLSKTVGRFSLMSCETSVHLHFAPIIANCYHILSALGEHQELSVAFLKIGKSENKKSNDPRHFYRGLSTAQTKKTPFGFPRLPCVAGICRVKCQ